MEAANLGAYAGAGRDLTTALDALGAVPTFTDITAWADVAFEVRAALGSGTTPPAAPQHRHPRGSTAMAAQCLL